MNWLRTWISPETYTRSADAGLFILRLAAGSLMFINHGWSKLTGFSEISGEFYDFMGLGTGFSLALTVFAEVLCSALLVIGLGTRLVLIPLIIMILVIIFDVNAGDSFAEKEKTLLFLASYLTIFFTGPGRYSLDQLFFPKPVTIPI